MLVSPKPLETRIFVVGDPALLERGREKLRRMRAQRPPGLAVDEVVEDLLDEGATGVLVQLDGIVRVAGNSPTGDGWLTVVAHPRGHFATAVLRLDVGAVATVSGSPAEVDPFDLVAVSVVAGEAWEAEWLAGAALAAGAGAVDLLRASGAPALLLNAFDESRPVNGWQSLSATAQAGRPEPGLLMSSA